MEKGMASKKVKQTRHMRVGKTRTSMILPTYLPSDSDLNPAQTLFNEEEDLILSAGCDDSVKLENVSFSQKAVSSSESRTQKVLNIEIKPLSGKIAPESDAGSFKILHSFWESQSANDKPSDVISPTPAVKTPVSSETPKLHTPIDIMKEKHLERKSPNSSPKKSTQEITLQYWRLIEGITHSACAKPSLESKSDKDKGERSLLCDSETRCEGNDCLPFDMDKISSELTGTPVNINKSDSNESELMPPPSTCGTKSTTENSPQWIKTPRMTKVLPKTRQKLFQEYSPDDLAPPSPDIRDKSKRKTPRKLMSLDSNVYSQLMTPPTDHSGESTSMNTSFENFPNERSDNNVKIMFPEPKNKRNCSMDLLSNNVSVIEPVLTLGDQMEVSGCSVLVANRPNSSYSDTSDDISLSSDSSYNCSSIESVSRGKCVMTYNTKNNDTQCDSTVNETPTSANNTYIEREVANVVHAVVKDYMNFSTASESSAYYNEARHVETYNDDVSETNRNTVNDSPNTMEVRKAVSHFSDTNKKCTNTWADTKMDESKLRKNKDDTDVDELSLYSVTDPESYSIRDPETELDSMSTVPSQVTDASYSGNDNVQKMDFTSALGLAEVPPPTCEHNRAVKVNENINYVPAAEVTDLDAYSLKNRATKGVPTLKVLAMCGLGKHPSVMYVKRLPETMTSSANLFVPVDTMNDKTNTKCIPVHDHRKGQLNVDIEVDGETAAKESERLNKWSIDPYFSPNLHCDEEIDSESTASDMLGWSPSPFDTAFCDDDIIPKDCDCCGVNDLCSKVFGRRKNLKRPRRLEFDTDSYFSNQTPPKLPKTPQTEFPRMNANQRTSTAIKSLNNTEFAPLVDLDVLESSVHITSEDIDTDGGSCSFDCDCSECLSCDYSENGWLTDVDYPESLNSSRRYNTSFSFWSMTSDDDTIDQSLGEDDNSTNVSSDKSEMNSSTVSASSEMDETLPVYIQTLPVNSAQAHDASDDRVEQIEPGKMTERVNSVDQGLQGNMTRDMLDQTQCSSPQVAVLEHNHSMTWKEVSVGSVSYSVIPSEATTQYAAECYNNAIYQQPEVQSQHSSYSDRSNENKTFKDNVAVPVDRVTDQTVAVNKPIDTSVKVNDPVKVNIIPVKTLASVTDGESTRDVVSMVETSVRQKLRKKIEERRDSLAEGELCKELKHIRPYVISGWLSTTYLMALVRKTDLVNEMFDKPFDENDEICEWIVENCHKTSPAILARDLVFRLFTLAELYQVSLTVLSRTKCYKAIKRCVQKCFPGKVPNSVWVSKCVPLIKSSLQTLFKYRMWLVQDFFLLHSC